MKYASFGCNNTLIILISKMYFKLCAITFWLTKLLMESSGIAGDRQDQVLLRISSRDDNDVRTHEEIRKLVDDETDGAARMPWRLCDGENGPCAIG